MRRNIVTYVLILVALLPATLAATAADLAAAGVTPTTDMSNPYLSASLQQQLASDKADIIKSVNDYNDQNFQVFDGRMTQMMADAKMKIALGAIGASLVAGAITTFFLYRAMRNYSFEVYQAKLIDQYKLQLENERNDKRAEGMTQMQQPEWNPQVPTQTMSMQYGQAFAGQNSQMNEWQAQPTYAGGWTPPVQTQPEPKPIIQDPMQSPGWDPQRGGY